MKIAIISKYFPPNIRGGGEISAYNLANGLARQGIDVHVITSKNIKDVPDSKFTLHPLFNVSNSIRILDPLVQNEFFYRGSTKALDTFLSQHRDFDLLNAWNMYSIPCTVTAAFKHNIPSVITINSHWLTCPSGWMMKNNNSICSGECSLGNIFKCYSDMKFPENIIGPLYSKQLMKKRSGLAEHADAVVNISESIENYVKNVITPKRSYVIPNIVEIEKYNQSPKEEFRSDLLFLGNLEKPKGCEYLIHAVSKITMKYPDIKLRIIGRGSEEKSLKKLSKLLFLESNIIFQGFVDFDIIPAYYASTSIVIFPSIWSEPFGRISIEAMAAGKPVVASRAGGITEVVEHGKTGFLVEPRNPEQIADSVLYLLDNKDIIKKMGINGIQETKKYSPEVISKKYIGVYNTVLEER